MNFKNTFSALLITTSLLTTFANANKDKEYVLEFNESAFHCIPKLYEAPDAVEASKKTKSFEAFQEKLKQEKKKFYSSFPYPTKEEEQQGHEHLQDAVKAWEIAAERVVEDYAKGLLLTRARDLIHSFSNDSSIFKYSQFEKSLKKQDKKLRQRVSKFYETQANLEENLAAKAAWLVRSAQQLGLFELQYDSSLIGRKAPLSFFQKAIELYSRAGKLYEQVAIEGPIESIAYTHPLRQFATFNLELKEKELLSLPKILASICNYHAGTYRYALWYHGKYNNEKKDSAEGSIEFRNVFDSLKKNFLTSASLMASTAQSEEEIPNTWTKAHLMREASIRIAKVISLSSIEEVNKTFDIKSLEKQYGRHLEDAYDLYEKYLTELTLSQSDKIGWKPHVLVRLADIRYAQAISAGSPAKQKELLEEAITQLKEAKNLSPSIAFNDRVWHGGNYDEYHRQYWLDKKIESLLEAVKLKVSNPENK